MPSNVVLFSLTAITLFSSNITLHLELYSFPTDVRYPCRNDGMIVAVLFAAGRSVKFGSNTIFVDVNVCWFGKETVTGACLISFQFLGCSFIR